MHEPAPAITTCAAGDVRVGRDSLPGMQVCDPRSYRLNNAGKFVSKDHRRRRARRAFDNVKVRSAHAATFNSNDDLSRPRMFLWPVDNVHSAGLGKKRCFHNVIFSRCVREDPGNFTDQRCISFLELPFRSAFNFFPSNVTAPTAFGVSRNASTVRPSKEEHSMFNVLKASFFHTRCTTAFISDSTGAGIPF